MADSESNQWHEAALSDDDLDRFGSRLELLPLEEAIWVAQVLAECRRARSSEAALHSAVDGASSEALQVVAQDVAQLVLDTAEWLKTLWGVGYMGAGRFPATPRSEFPSIEVEDVLKSALLQRIRSGRRPLPFPPPTRNGMPWHELVESPEKFFVEATLIRDDWQSIIGVNIEGCTDWMVCEVREPECEWVVQHQGKGPRYLMRLDPMFSSIQRQDAQLTRTIVVKERAGFQTYFLEWPDEATGQSRRISLRAMNWERAESEAQYWVATHFPEMYGQIRFEASEA